MHAVNNAFQVRLVTCEEMNAEVERMVKRSKNQDTFRKHLRADDGYYSPSVLFRLLKQRGYSAKLRQDVPRGSSGKFIVFGLKKGYSHAVAIVDGYVLDSEENAPKKLPAKTFFDRFSVGQIFELVPSKPFTRKKRSAEVIDLT